MILVEIRCKNSFCREVVRTGKPQVIGKVEAGAAAELWCAKCKTTAIYTARATIPIS